MVKPQNPEKNPTAARANARLGYGPNNPEPDQFKQTDKNHQEKLP